MRRVNLSLPDDAADALEELSAMLGVSRSGFLAAYLSRRLVRLRDVAVWAEHIRPVDDSDGSPARRFGRGNDGELFRIAEELADLEARRAYRR